MHAMGYKLVLVEVEHAELKIVVVENCGAVVVLGVGCVAELDDDVDVVVLGGEALVDVVEGPFDEDEDMLEAVDDTDVCELLVEVWEPLVVLDDEQDPSRF